MAGVRMNHAHPGRAELGPGPNDCELMERFVCRGDRTALAALVDRFSGMVWGVCRRLLATDQDAEDAFQATFLVLTKKAGTIRRAEGVGSWLYGVAYRTALKARRDRATQRRVESRAAPPAPPPSPPGAAACRELQGLLDEEVQRLPAKLRAPFVLCCIEGRSKAEAAQELGWKEGTVSGRLAQARRLLQKRLLRRGVTLAAALTLVALGKEAAAAAVPALLVPTTVAGLSGSAAGQAGAGLSPAAVSLAHGVVRGLAAAKLKLLGVAFLAATLAVGGTAVAVSQLAQAPRAEPVPPAVPAPGAPGAVQARALTFTGPALPFRELIDEQVMAVAFSPDGKRLATAGAGPVHPGQITIWDVATRHETRKLRPVPGTHCVAFSPDGRVLACGEFGGAIALRDAETGRQVATLPGHTAGVNGLAYSPDGKWLVSAGLDGVKLWDTKARAERKAFIGHTDAVFSVAFFRHGKGFVSAGRDKTARVWEVGQDKELRVLRGHQAPVEQVAISPDDRLVATASGDHTIKLWDAASGAEKAVLAGHQDAVFAVAFSDDGAWLASGSADGEVRL